MTTDSRGMHSAPARARVSTKTFVVLALLVCLALAGAVSHYASDSPDGLNRVATDQGLAKEEVSSATADSPLAGYSTSTVANDRLSGGIAGVAGVAVVLVLAGGLAYAVRRRGTRPES